MPSQSPSWAEVLSGAIDTALQEVFVAMPGRVESFDAATQRASVQPLVRRAYYDAELDETVNERHPVIPDVPICFPGAGDWRLTFPIVKGDTVLLVFASCSLDRWLSRGGEVDPEDDRRHSLSDAVAIPGLYSFGGTSKPSTPVPSDAMTFHGTAFKFGPDATDRVARESDLRALRELILGAPDGPTFGTELKATMRPIWPNCQSKVSTE
ncbi:MAG: Gp138 family membrane-puncturing spike protein [Kofleriaceae bacterium]